MISGTERARRLYGSPLGVVDGNDHDDPDDREAPSSRELLRGEHTDDLERHEEDGKLEAETESQHHQHDEAEVGAGSEQRLHVTRERDEELQRLRERPVAR